MCYVCWYSDLPAKHQKEVEKEDKLLERSINGGVTQLLSILIKLVGA
jgi:hypothetical protein